MCEEKDNHAIKDETKGRIHSHVTGECLRLEMVAMYFFLSGLQGGRQTKKIRFQQYPIFNFLSVFSSLHLMYTFCKGVYNIYRWL